MLAVVKMPRTEIAFSGPLESVSEILGYLRNRYTVDVLSCDPKAEEDEWVDIFETDFWKETLPGDLIAGYRMKHELSQEELAQKCGMHQTLISAYETGKRKLTQKAAIKIGTALGEDPRKFFPKNAGKRND